MSASNEGSMYEPLMAWEGAPSGHAAIEKTNKLDVHRTHTPRCKVKKIIALWRMHAVMQGWKEVGCED